MPPFTSTVKGPVRLGDAASHARAVLPALLAVVLVAPGCGYDNPTIPDVSRSIVDVSVAPNPVLATQNELTFAVTANYTITLKETNGLGGEVVFISAAVYEPASGKQVALTYSDSADLIVYKGGKRIEPLGELVLAQATSYTLSDGSKPADLVVTVQFKDDRTNLVHSSLLAKIE